MPPRSSCFRGCFGGQSVGDGLMPENKRINGRNNKWFIIRWSKLMKKKSYPTKTVPIIDVPSPTDDDHEKLHQKKMIKTISKKKLQKEQTSEPLTQKNVLIKPNQTKYDEVEEIILEKSKSMNHLAVSTTTKKAATFKRGPSKSNSSSPTSPEDIKYEVSRTGGLPYSVSMPLPRKKKTVDGDSKLHGIQKKKTLPKIPPRVSSRYDQLVGMSFILVTLIVMVFWGKICAILCTAAWFYFYPLFIRSQNQPKFDQENRSKSGLWDENQLDLNSQEYKKKVILEGLLERNNRILH